MEPINEFRYFPFSTKLAVFSFLIGTLIFGMFFIVPDHDGVIILGLIYIIFAVFFNSIMLLRLLYLLLTEPPAHREAIIVRMLILLANIPIAFLYGYLIIRFISSDNFF